MKANIKISINALLIIIVLTSFTGSTYSVNASQFENEVNQSGVLIKADLDSMAANSGDPRAVSAGEYHACAINAAGGVECWGYNVHGELGDGTTENRPTPVEVVGLASGVVSISVGEYFTCALTSAGGMKCWGEDPYRDGTYHDPSIPSDIPGMTEGVTAISTGRYHVCALTNTGTVQCWGSNFDGQLGDGTMTSRYIPADVLGLDTGVTAINAGGYSTCALTVDGEVKCWGDNDEGQLGDQTTINRTQPVDVFGLTGGVKGVDVGISHACAVTIEGTVKCWGSNEYGQLGDSTKINSSNPVDVVNLSEEVISVSAGQSHTCALTISGGVKCWGENLYGQLGDGSVDGSLTPVDVVGLQSGVTSLSAGYRFTCGVTPYSIKCWGWGDFGQLGSGTAPIFEIVRDGWGLTWGIQQITSGYYHNCALTTLGGVKCWGGNEDGQLGHGGFEDNPTPIEVTGLTSGVISISANGYHSCAVTSSGGVQCWGDNVAGQLGDGTTIKRDYPVDVVGLEGRVVSVAAGEYFTCALTDNGGVQCWGTNYDGQLGNGTETDSLTPVPVIGLPDPVRQLSAGGLHTCAITITNEVFCWGWNEYGQLGNNSNTSSSTPVKVESLSNHAQSISTGIAHSCALLSGGEVMCWGINSIGQLGTGTKDDSSVPVAVIGLEEEVVAIGSGCLTTCAALNLGGAKCWGGNPYGNLGDGTDMPSLTPVEVIGLNDQLQSISIGLTHVCALTINGGVKCWGDYLYGALTLKIVTIPTDVTNLSSYPYTYYFPIIMR